MATFTPPVTTKTPPVEVITKGQERKLFRHFRGDDQADTNVYILTDGTVLSETPQSTYDADSVLDEEALSRTARVFYGGHAPETVTAAEQALLEAAGYTVTP